jgi:hypothetical protein
LAMVTLTRPDGWWFLGFVLLIVVVGLTCGELASEIHQLSESQAWGDVRLRLDEEGLYFGDEDKFISWSRLVRAELFEERGESQDSELLPGIQDEHEAGTGDEHDREVIVPVSMFMLSASCSWCRFGGVQGAARRRTYVSPAGGLLITPMVLA